VIHEPNQDVGSDLGDVLKLFKKLYLGGDWHFVTLGEVLRKHEYPGVSYQGESQRGQAAT
jgi:hypothetical protein